MVGFECELVEEPLCYLQTRCPVCLQILREPYQVICCGKSFCRECIEQVKADNKPCPCCKQDSYNDYPNKALQQRLYEFHVHCSNKGEGCEWTGELGQFDSHLNLNQSVKDNELEGCEFAKIKCTYCSGIVKRNELQYHKKELCDKRPFSCEYCSEYESTYEDIVLNHWPVCGYHPVKCPNECGTFPQRHKLESHIVRDCLLTVIECDFKYTGCEVRLPRKDMPCHFKDSLSSHCSLLAVKQQEENEAFKAKSKRQQDEIKALKVKCEQLQDKIETISKRLHDKIEALKEEICQLKGQTIVFPIDFVVNNPHQYSVVSPWSSKHFYSHLGGYKLKVKFCSSRMGAYQFTPCLMQGEFDSHLKWPMKADLSILILHKRRDGEDHKFSISAKCNKPITDGCTVSCGEWSPDVYIDWNEYLYDNCLCLRITDIQIN